MQLNKPDIGKKEPKQKYSESIIDANYSARFVLKRAENGEESVTHTPPLIS